MPLPSIPTQVGPYPIEYIAAHPANVWPTDDGLEKEGGVCHIMEGTLEACISWFRNPAAQASATAGIAKSGRIVLFVPLYGKAPYANGVGRNEAAKVAAMDPLVKALSVQYGWVSQNKWTWSIEHEGKSGEQITDFPKMFDASTRLMAMLLASLPPTKRHTFGHYQFDNVTRSGCPGWTTPTWKAYDDRVAALIGEAEGGGPVADFDWSKVKPIVDEGYKQALQTKQSADESFKKWQELFEEIRRQIPGAV